MEQKTNSGGLKLPHSKQMAECLILMSANINFTNEVSAFKLFDYLTFSIPSELYKLLKNSYNLP